MKMTEKKRAAQKANSAISAAKKKLSRLGKTCECCRSPFTVTPSAARKNACRFCSNKCRYLFMQGPHGAAAGPRPDLTGCNHWAWNGGLWKTRRNAHRVDPAVVRWRLAIYRRDWRRCQWCGTESHAIVAHHITPWAACETLRFEVDNGVTLCRACHTFVHSSRNVDGMFLAIPIATAYSIQVAA